MHLVNCVQTHACKNFCIYCEHKKENMKLEIDTKDSKHCLLVSTNECAAIVARSKCSKFHCI